MKNIQKIIRYGFIFVVYNFILSCIAYTVDWINDAFFNYSMANWDFMSYWLFISTCILIGGFMLYTAPLFEQFLENTLEKKILNINENMDNNKQERMG